MAMQVPDDLRYTKDHEWVRIQGGEFTVGITHYAQEQLSEIVYVELPAPGTAMRQGEPFGTVEAVKAASDLFSPLSGEVVAANDALAGDPAAVNRSPYEEGWMVRGRLGNAAEVNQLLTAEQYRALLGELGGKGA